MMETIFANEFIVVAHASQWVYKKPILGFGISSHDLT